MKGNFTLKTAIAFLLLICAGTTRLFAQFDLVVAKDGSGNFTTVQAAINAAPTGRTAPYKIFIRNGVYKEKINIPSTKPFIQLIGESVANTLLTDNDAASSPAAGGGTVGTFNSASIIINATDFSAMNLSFENSFGDGSQAVAVQVNGDRAAFVNCRFLGNQDTLLTNGTTGLRQYFKNCYIDGNIDFIFGSAIAVFDSCVIYAKTRTTAGSSFITAANTPPGQAFGYVFRNCRIPSNTGGTLYYLGRPWQNETGSSPLANNKVVYLNATLGYTLRPEGWVIWDAGTDTTLIYYAEYKSIGFNGTPTDVSKRVTWSHQLGDADTAAYNLANLFGAWDPCSVSPNFCAFVPPPIAVSNFKGVKGSAGSSFTWNISWPMSSLKYALFRSTNDTSFMQINEVDAVTDTAVNFALTDTLPPPGSVFYYYIQASGPGLATQITDTIQISSKPTITTTGALSSFIQGLGLPSAVQVYTVAGANLISGVTLIPPAGYEISPDKGKTWFNQGAPLTLPASSNAIASDTITVRLNALTAGAFAGNIIHAATGADTVLLAVTGNVQSTPLIVSNILMHWPMSTNAVDNAAERSADLAPDTALLNRLTVSNGTTVPAVAAFSTNYGQAFGPSANGDGTWSTAVGGPGGNLNRNTYEQFSITASGTDTVRVDSILLTSSFYNTSSNTKLAVVSSKSGFTADSADVTGGTGPSGSLVATANGAFATPIALPNETAGTTAAYHLAVAGATGINLAPGQTLTIRCYFSCGSSSVGRYGKVKDVYIKGLAKSAPVFPILTLSGNVNSFFQDLGIPSDARGYQIAGKNLTTGVTIIPPAGYEVSPDAGLTWYNNANPLVLPENGGNAPDTTIMVRLNTTATGSLSGNILHVSAGADTVVLPVTGITVSNATRQIAFPGAEGFGRFAQGGRGGTIYEVTNLNDDGPGSLRDAVSQPNRTVIFKVSGTIQLKSTLKITNDNITIAGQTAPGDGICTSGFTVTIAANNIIIRYVRFRLGDITADIDDACNSFKGSFHDIIVDHCSMSWSVDETGSFYDIQQFTLQWSILSESLFHSVDPKGNHGYAGIWGGQGTTYHHNLLAHHSSRNPRFSGSRYLGSTVTGTVDMRNNVIYNWGDINSAYGGEGGTQNMVNNYFKPGPATPGSLTLSSVSNKRNRILNYTSFYFASDAFVYPDTLFGGKFYIDGNFVEGYPDVSADNWTKGVQPDDYPGSAALIAAARQPVPFPFAPINTQTAQDAYPSVLNNAGAILPHRDTVDRRVLKEARLGIAEFEGADYATVTETGVSHPSGIIDSQNDVGGWPTLNSTTPLPDSDHDGMPDVWELRRGLNPADPTDGNGVNANGYTNLENYLNGDSIVAPGIANTCVSSPALVFTGSGNWVHAKDTASSLLIYTDTTNLVASVKDNGNYGTFQVSYYTTDSTRLLPNTFPYLNRNISIVSSGAVGSPVTMRLYFTRAEFAALQAADTSIKSLAGLSILQVDTNTCLPALSGAFTIIAPTAMGAFGTYNDGYYIEFTTSSFGNFFIAGTVSAAIPPFSITSFNAAYANTQVKTTWTVSNLLGVSDFVIERGVDTTQILPLGTTMIGDSTGHLSYAFTDTDPLAHSAWYRLKAEKTDGTAVYSQALEVGPPFLLLALPNPAHNTIIVLYPVLLLDKMAKQAFLDLYSLNGALLRSIPVAPGSVETTVNLSGLAQGIYVFVMQTSDGRKGTITFIKF